MLNTDELHIMLSGADPERAKEIPAWELCIREGNEEKDSWLGGLPKAPRNFRWPISRFKKPQHFLAQIDLDKLGTGRLPGLPESGAMLLFWGFGFENGIFAMDYTCKFISPSEVQTAKQIEHPEDIESLREFGFYDNKPTLTQQFVETIPYVSDESGACPSDTFEHKKTAYAAHRLFGVEPPFQNNWDDLRGYDCLISVSSDSSLGTKSDNDYGFSIWCKRQDMAKGEFSLGKVVRHIAV